MINNKILIFPDIHGRTFWKKPCETPEKYDKIIFLGDYVDPYYDEGISKEDTITNLEEIIEFKKQNSDKTILLIGNHDMSYLNDMMPRSRFDGKNKDRIIKLFEDNVELFDIAYEENINGKRYLFSHSGILWAWVEDFKDMYEWTYPNKDNIVDFLNNLFHTAEDKAASILYMVSRYRGGWDKYGSCVWGDLEEFYSYDYNDKNPKIENSYQVFGHTMLAYRPFVTKTFACLDYSTPIEMVDGKFYMPSGDEIPETIIKKK